MNKHNVELAPPAVRMYDSICRLAAGEKDGARTELRNSVDEVFDNMIPFRPFELGTELGGTLAGVYWISRGTLHVFYEASTKPSTIVVLFIWDGPNSEAHFQQADILCTELLLAGRLQLKTATPTRRAAAN
ncbi:MAG: hypothetical protein WCC97_13060 [Candidatus Acidiferrales bacterium]